MPTYGLGIDAGGTYTDTVILDLDSSRIVCGNKALTTRNDLSIGIRESINGLDHGLLEQISLTSLSSTLATNSVVEGKGCRTGLISIGTVYKLSEKLDFYSQIAGKFDMSGTEVVPLDVDSVKKELSKMKGKIDALAISGYLSIRNPSHELTVAEISASILGVPVVCAHELTSQLGFEQRTTTALMNARLIPVIQELLSSVRKVLKEFHISSPLMIVKGDGSLMNEAVAEKKPVETILSGPASSIMGAKTLSSRQNCIVVDIGGTTTDVGVIRNGIPQIDPEGALIGGQRTRVLAANVFTSGIGGDSRIVVNGTRTILSSVRAIPVCVAASKWDSVRRTISSLAEETDDRSEEDYDLGDVLQNTEFFILAHPDFESDITSENRALLEQARNGPVRLIDAARVCGIPPHAFNVSELENRGFVTRIGVTPTDILHAEGSYTEYDSESSAIAVGYLARKCGKSVEEFISDTKSQIVNKMASSIMEKVLLDSSGKDRLTPTETELIERTIDSRSDLFHLGFSLKYPLVGIGAPVNAWMPEVSRILNTELVLPEDSCIGNAVGAISGSVSETVTVTVRANSDGLDECPECTVFTGKGRKVFDSPESALDYAISEGTSMAKGLATKSGSSENMIEVSTRKDYLELSEKKKYFRSATVIITAIGKPDLH